MKKLFAIALAAVLAALASGPGGATVFLPFDLVSQVGDSDLVFEGTVELTYACPTEERDLPRTCASVAIDRVMKGEHAPSHVTVVVPGGMADNGTYVQLLGAPTLREGETVIASTFLTPARHEELVGLVNFDTALLRRQVKPAGVAVAMNAQGRVLRSLPLRDRPVFDEPGLEGKASDGSETLSWAAARRAIENAIAMSAE